MSLEHINQFLNPYLKCVKLLDSCPSSLSLRNLRTYANDTGFGIGELLLRKQLDGGLNGNGLELKAHPAL